MPRTPNAGSVSFRTAVDYGIPESGSPLYAATIGVEDVTRSARFYDEALGLDLIEQRHMEGRDFTAHWALPAGTTAEMAVLGDRQCRLGRVALLQFNVSGRQTIRNVEGQCVFGFVNLNFYTNDIYAHTARLEAAGCSAWSAPLVHDMGAAVGQPIEVMLEGPDGVIVNLIELRADNPDARILRTRAYIEDTGGYNRCGGTPVVTSAHNVQRYEPAMAFYSQVLGMSIRNDVVLAGEDMERFTRFPKGAHCRDTYVQGNHVFGKVAVIHPLNFPCVDIVPRAIAPNIGYISQTFIVPDLAEAVRAARRLDCDAFSPTVEIDFPALGPAISAVVRNPGSGALHELIQLP